MWIPVHISIVLRTKKEAGREIRLNQSYCELICIIGEKKIPSSHDKHFPWKIYFITPFTEIH